MKTITRAAIVFVVVFSASFFYALAGAQEFTDTQTGARLRLPLPILNGPKPTTFGNSWATPDNLLKIATLNFRGKKSLRDVYNVIRNKPGRSLSVDRFETASFILQGNDRDESFFIVKAEEKDGEVRGISVTYERSVKEKYASSALKIVEFYQAFPLTEPNRSKATLASATSCHIVNSHGPNAKVGVVQPSGKVKTGDRIKVVWDASASIAPDCKTPLYLVLTTPLRSRFEGDRFLALPPGTEGPFGIKYQVERTRVFVPLHLGLGEHTGSFDIKVYQAGPLILDWALVEVPSFVASPQARADLGVGREVATTSSPVGQELTVIGGNPVVVVRDRFTTDTPKKVIHSNSGEFELQVFEDYYRVLDARAGELIQERTGRDPNFSPSSRFLGAYSAGPGFEIVDLFAGQTVTSNDILLRERGFSGNVHLAAWSPGDAFFALSLTTWGGVELQQSLVDGSQRSFPSTACHYCEGIQNALHVDIDQASRPISMKVAKKGG